MKPPQAPGKGETAKLPETPAAVSFSGPRKPLENLRNRKDFLAAARASYKPMPGFVLQARFRDDQAPPRVGFTCSKKVGNAVQRNKAKRRLREIARLALAPVANPGWDYVLIGKRSRTATLDFERLQADLKAAVEHLHDTARKA